MRIASDTKSEYYDEKLVGLFAYLDGKKVKYALEADDVEGWVECFKLDENGEAYVVDGEIAKEKLYGKIDIK